MDKKTNKIGFRFYGLKNIFYSKISFRNFDISKYLNLLCKFRYLSKVQRTFTKSNGFVYGLLIFCIIITSGLNFVSAAVPEEDPFFAIGNDFLEIEASDYDPYINVLFDNTNIYVDLDDGGVWDYKYTQNAGSTLTISIPILGISSGARIHADKPVEYYQYLGPGSYWVPGYGYRNHNYYITIPPITSLKNNYYPHDGGWYIVVPEDTTINVDVDNDGTIDDSINVSKRTRPSISISSGHCARVYGDDPFYLYNSYTVACPSGVDFYIPWETVNKLVVTENNTIIQVDTNNDGHYEQNLTQNAGVYGSFTFNRGSHIHSNKPITVFVSQGTTMCVPPSTYIGSDLWSKTDGGYSYITGLFDNTTYHLDRVSENDLNPNYNYNINANTINSLPGSGRVHIWGDKPFMESYYYYVQHIGGNYYGVFPYSSILSTTYSAQKYLGTNELTTMQVGVFNPFADTPVSDLNVTISFPDDFSMPLGITLELNIEKQYLRNDTVIENDTILVTPVHTGSKYEFTISSTETSLLSTLGSMQYYNIEYQIVTPSVLGSYTFDPVNVNYTSETWNMPE